MRYFAHAACKMYDKIKITLIYVTLETIIKEFVKTILRRFCANSYEETTG